MATLVRRWRDAATSLWFPAFFSNSPGRARGQGGALLRTLALSGLLAMLHVSASLYMLAIYDQVLPSGSVTALAALVALATVFHGLSVALDVRRTRAVLRAGLDHVELLDRRVLTALKQENGGLAFALLDDVERVRRFLTGPGPCAVLDGLWTPAFLFAVFVVHPVLGAFACAAMALLAWLALSTEVREREARHPVRLARRARYVLVRDLQACRSHGDGARWLDTIRRWRVLSRSYSELTFSAYVRTLPAVGLGRGLRPALQSAGVGLAALLAIEGLISPGALLAASLLIGRTLGALDGALAHWQGLVAARESHQRLAAAISARDPARS